MSVLTHLNEASAEAVTKLVKLEGRLDAAGVNQKKPELMSRMTAEDTNVVINMSEVSFVDSTGLGLLVGVQQQQEGFNRKLVLCEVSDQIRLLLELTRLNLVFDIYDTQESALAAT